VIFETLITLVFLDCILSKLGLKWMFVVGGLVVLVWGYTVVKIRRKIDLGKKYFNY
jgi:hypothetical protein